MRVGQARERERGHCVRSVTTGRDVVHGTARSRSEPGGDGADGVLPRTTRGDLGGGGGEGGRCLRVRRAESEG